MPNLNIIRSLIRWYHKNSFNKNYVLLLESAIEEKDKIIADLSREEQHKERERVVMFCRERDDVRHTSLSCNLIIGDYVICKVKKENSPHGNELEFYIKSSSDSYILYGWDNYYKCKSNDRYVTQPHHQNYRVFRDVLVKLLEEILNK